MKKGKVVFATRPVWIGREPITTSSWFVECDNGDTYGPFRNEAKANHFNENDIIDREFMSRQ